MDYRLLFLTSFYQRILNASQYKHAVLKYATFAHLRQQSLYKLDFKSIDILKA